MPLIVVNAPAMTIDPALGPGVLSIATAFTEPFAPVPTEKVGSIEPSAFKRVMRLMFELFTEVKSPTTITLPPGNGATPRTVLFTPAPPTLKVVSSVPM